MDNRCEGLFISGLALIALFVAAGIVVAAGGMSASWSVIDGGGGLVGCGWSATVRTAGGGVLH